MLEGRALTRVEAIVLDLDDTVFDAGEWTVAALSHGAALRGMAADSVERAISEYLRTRNPHDPALYNAILLGCFQSDNGFNVRALHEAAGQYRGADRGWEPYPGVPEALAELRRHYRLILMAEGPVDQQKAKIKALGIEGCFNSIIFTDEIDGPRSRRPDPRPFQLLREQLDLQGRQILFVGDQPARDFKEARRQGFVTCRVFTGASRAEDYPDASFRADYEATSLARLPELLASSQRSLSSYLLSHLPFLGPVGRSSPLVVEQVQHEVAAQLNLDLSLTAAAPAQAQLQVELAPMPQAPAPPATADQQPALVLAAPATPGAPAFRRDTLQLLPSPALRIGARRSPPRPRLQESISRRLLLHVQGSGSEVQGISLD